MDEIRARMRNEWEVDVAELESRGDVIIRTTKVFYFLDDIPPANKAPILVENSISKKEPYFISPYFSREQHKQKRAVFHNRIILS